MPYLCGFWRFANAYHSCIMKGELKKSVLQSLKEFQARAKAQEQENKEVEKSKAHLEDYKSELEEGE